MKIYAILVKRLAPLIALPLILGWIPLYAAPIPTAHGRSMSQLQNGSGSDTGNTSIGGKLFSDIGPFADRGAAVAVQPDTKIIVAGSTEADSGSDFAVIRYTTLGTLDRSFGGDGIVLTDFGGNDQAAAVAIQPDGKIVVAGTSDAGGSTDVALARYLPNGDLDPSFDGDGKRTSDLDSDSEDQAHAVILQPDGTIVVAGGSCAIDNCNFDAALVRYTAAGSLDASFSGDGIVLTDFGGFLDTAAALVIQPNGRLVAAGTTDDSFALVRYTAGGSLDTSFSGDGIVTTGFSAEGMSAAYGLALMPDGKLVAAGQSTDNGDIALARYTATGALDATFAGDGRLTTDFGGNERGAAVVAQPDGTIVVAGASDAGSSTDFVLARYTPNGALDPAFDGDGKLATDFFGADDQALALARQPDGTLIAAGFAQRDHAVGFAVARYRDGVLAANRALYLPLIGKGR